MNKRNGEQEDTYCGTNITSRHDQTDVDVVVLTAVVLIVVVAVVSVATQAIAIAVVAGVGVSRHLTPTILSLADTAGAIIGRRYLLTMLAVVLRKGVVKTNSIASVGNHGILTISWVIHVGSGLVGDKLTGRVQGLL